MNYQLGPHESLTLKSSSWDFNIDVGAKELEDKMCQFMTESKGIGLAANQIGITKRVFVIGSYNIKDFPIPFALFNPRIIEESKDLVIDSEGCLSYPGLYLNVKRPSWIIAEYQNSNGDSIEAKFEGYLAKCFQHELDHLNGVCFVDKVSRMKLDLAIKKFKKRR